MTTTYTPTRGDKVKGHDEAGREVLGTVVKHYAFGATAVMDAAGQVHVIEDAEPRLPHYVKTDIAWGGSGSDGDPWVMTSWDVKKCDCLRPWGHEALA